MHEKSTSWQRRAEWVMPGYQSNFRHRADAPPPIILDSAQGARYRDVDGKEFIDYVIGMGPAIWGHSDQGYQQAIQSQLTKMMSIALPLRYQRWKSKSQNWCVNIFPVLKW